MEFISGNLIAVVIIVLLLFKSFVVIQQGMMGVVTVFGKYRRVLSPGLNFTIPFIEVVFKKISTQNRSVEMEFQAVTFDQANVYFKSMLLYSVMSGEEEVIKRVAFKFIDERSLMQALVRTIEGTIRALVSLAGSAD